MGDKAIATKSKLTAIGDAIRNKTGETDLYTLDEMPGKIRSIEGGVYYGGAGISIDEYNYINADVIGILYKKPYGSNTVTCNMTFSEVYDLVKTSTTSDKIVVIQFMMNDNGETRTTGVAVSVNSNQITFRFERIRVAFPDEVISWVVIHNSSEQITYDSSNEYAGTREYQHTLINTDDNINIEKRNTAKDNIYINPDGPLAKQTNNNTMIGTANGDIATFSDGGDNIPMKSCVVSIEPVQSGSGDPSPQNERPISGWTECNVTRAGKNLAQLTYGNQVPSTSTGEMVSSNGWSSDFFELDKTKSYVASTTASSRYIMFYDESKTYLGYIVTYANGYVLNSNQYWANAKYIKHRSDAGSGTAPDIQLEIGSTATDYEPYQANTYNIEFPSEVGTVYGGTLDVVSGVLTVTYILIDMGTLTWGTSGATYLATSGIDSAIITTADIGQGFICSHYTPSTNWSLPDDKTMAIWTTQVRVKDTDYATPEAFKTAMNGVKLCYKVRVPQTYNLTPTEIKTLLGINNIFADTGDVLNAEYTRDATTIINSLIARIEALENA